MNKSIFTAILLTAGSLSQGYGGESDFQNFIRQVQLPSDGTEGTVWNVTVESSGEELSPLPINPNGARFELHTVKSNPLTGYLLDTKYVSSTVPVAVVQIRTEDPYETVPRTRADRPFNVEISVDGLVSGPDDPEALKKVKLLHHVQSFGEGGDGSNLNRTQATLLGQGFIDSNGDQVLQYLVNSVAGADRSKVRGEERFSVFSLEHPEVDVPESQLDSATVQIWPVADGTISGIAQGQLIDYQVPDVTIAVNDIYPNAQIYAQVYEGNQSLGTEGTVVSGSALIIEESVPQNRVLVVEDWDDVIPKDGVWTIELLTATPFGIDRLDWVTFNVDRVITVNGSVTTTE